MEPQQERLREAMAATADRFDDALFNQDVDALRVLLADGVVLHADLLTLDSDRVGADAVAAFYAAYFRISSKHLPAGRALNPEAKSAFLLWSEKPDAAPPAPAPAALLSGVTRLVFDAAGERVAHIWPLRQMTPREASARLARPPGATDFSAKELLDAAAARPDGGGEAAARAAAECCQRAWATGDAGCLAGALADDVRVVSPVFGEEKRSRAEYEGTIRRVREAWAPAAHASDTAVTPGVGAAFTWWRAEGDAAQATDIGPAGGGRGRAASWGINVLVFEEGGGGRAALLASFRAPTPGEHDRLVKGSRPYLQALAEQ